MENMIQSCLFFPAGCCARSLCRATCSSGFMFSRESFPIKDKHLHKAYRWMLSQACPPMHEGQHWAWEAEHHTPDKPIPPSARNHWVLWDPPEPKSHISDPKEHLGEESVMLLQHKAQQGR